MPYDEWKDNSTLEKMADDLNNGGTNLVLGSLDQLINWGRSNSLWSLTFATSCCGIEFMAVGCARYDFSRFGFEVTRKLSTTGRPDNVCRNHNKQNGTSTKTLVRPDGRAKIRNSSGRLRNIWWSV